MEREPISVRFPSTVLARLDQRAKEVRRTRTELIEESVVRCLATDFGRTLVGGFTPPGLTSAFDEWLKSRKGGDQVTLLAQSPSGGPPSVFSGRLHAKDLETAKVEGFFLLRVRHEELGDDIPVPLSRALLLGWTTEDQDRLYLLLCGLGLARDGNAEIKARVQVKG
jgi:hypothetical protein